MVNSREYTDFTVYIKEYTIHTTDYRDISIYKDYNYLIYLLVIP